MSDPTTVIALDMNADLVYEDNITSDVLEAAIRRGRQEDISQAEPGTCRLLLRNEDGRYTPKGAGAAPLHPFKGVRVSTSAPASANHFTGFIRRVSLDPKLPGSLRVEAADWLWVLSRTDISRPLMRDAQSGILLHRIVDLAEVGEHCDNPRFRDDLTGYSDGAWGGGGGATSTRVTTGTIMEGPASMETVSTAWGGWRYSIPHDADSEFQSLKVVAAAYMWAASSADVGEVVRLQLASNLSADLGYADLTLSMLPQRVSATGTFDATAGSFYVQAYPTTNATFRTGAGHIVSYKSAVPRNFDVGQATFSYVAPRRVNALAALQEAAENEMGGWIYVDGSGTLCFEDRHHRWTTATDTKHTTSQGTIDETMIDLPYTEDADDRVGLVEMHHIAWEAGTAGSTVFQLYPVPRAIPPNGTLTLNIDYGAIVRDHIVPVATTDWLCNASPDGGGADETGNVSIAYDDYGGGGQAVLTNSVARTVWLTTFKVRGTPVRSASDTPQITYTPAGAPDFASKLRYSYNLQDKKPAVEAWAQYLGDRYVTQRERLPVPLINRNATILTQMLARDISERVTITADNTAHGPKVNGDYYIESIEHRFGMGTKLVETVWGVVPVDNNFWRLGTGELGDDQTQTTTTAVAP